MCVIATQQYGCGHFKNPSAHITLCHAAKTVFPPSPCSTSTFPSLNAAPFGPEDVGADSGRKHILEGWVQRSLWMCFDCCPVKEFKGNYGELWSNWTGSSIGQGNDSSSSLSELDGMMDAATAKYRRVTMATSPVREIVARHGSPTTAEFSSTTQVQELNSSGDEASTDTDLARAASFHQSFWVQGSGSSKGARVLGISETGNDVDVVSKAETWPKPSSRPSRLARVLERVSSKVASFENAPGFS